MKRRITLLGIGLIAALLILAGDRSAVLAQSECSETEQAFNIPESFPLDGDDWIDTELANTVNGSIIERHANGFSVSSSGDGNDAGALRLFLPTPATITHIEFDMVGSGDNVTGGLSLCEDIDCATAHFYGYLVSGEPPRRIEEDFEIDNIIVIQLIVNGAPTSGIDNLKIDGVLDACLFRPVHSEDVIAQVEDEETGVWTLATNAGAPVFAVDDGSIVAVYHDATGYQVGLAVNGVDVVVYFNLEVVFAKTGDVIEGGCVLGYAGIPPPGVLDGLGYTEYQPDPDLGDWRDYAESLSNTPCNETTSNCLNANPEFNDNGTSWLSRYAIANSLNDADDSAMLLPKGGELYQPGFTVALADTYYITLGVTIQGVAPTGEITVSIGGASSTMAVTTSGGVYKSLTSQALSPAFNGISELRIDNTFDNPVTLKITFACLHSGDAVIPPPACYFDDANLTTDSFATESGASFEDSLIGVGRYSIPPGGVIRSPVDISAFSDADTDYRLRIQGAAPDGAGELTASIVDSGDDSELQAIGTYSYAGLLWAELTKTFTLATSEHVIGDLYIENTGSEDVLVAALCLYPVGGLFPGYQNPDVADHSLVPVSCSECTLPDSLLDVVAWLNWLGCVFRYLIFCLLYTLVNNVWNTVLAIMSGIGLFGRWLGRAISIVVDFLWRAGGRLLASLLGNAIPILNAIMAWILSLPFVRDILDAATIAGLWINGVIAFILGVVNLFVAAVRFVGVLITLVGTVWVAFIEGLSTASAISVPLPDCNNSGSTFYDVCLLFDVLNFIVAQSIVGVAITALFSAVGISILWHGGRQVKDEIERVFES